LDVGSVAFKAMSTKNLFCVEEYVAGLGQLFCFPRKIVKFPIHFCLVYFLCRLQLRANHKILNM
jgi:hypothetical protein